MAGKKKPIKGAVDSAQQLWTAGVGAITKAPAAKRTTTRTKKSAE